MKRRMTSATSAVPMPIPALAPVERLLLDWVAGMGVRGVEVLELGVMDEEDEGDGEDGEIGDVGFEEGESEGDEDEGSDGDAVDCVMLEDWTCC
jgi:hypothetical protein